MYNLPRHDPRVDSLTSEEMIYELILNAKYEEALKRGPIDTELQKKIQAWADGDDNALPVNDDEWEDVEVRTNAR